MMCRRCTNYPCTCTDSVDVVAEYYRRQSEQTTMKFPYFQKIVTNTRDAAVEEVAQLRVLITDRENANTRDLARIAELSRIVDECNRFPAG